MSGARSVEQWKTFIEGCLDFRPADEVFRIARDMFTEPELFDLEMELIFEKNWIWIPAGLELDWIPAGLELDWSWTGFPLDWIPAGLYGSQMVCLQNSFFLQIGVGRVVYAWLWQCVFP